MCSIVHACFLCQVLNLSKFLLLETAAPAAIVRLKNSELTEEIAAIKHIYFEEQHHRSIEDFLRHHLHSDHRDTSLLMQVCVSGL